MKIRLEGHVILVLKVSAYPVFFRGEAIIYCSKKEVGMIGNDPLKLCTFSNRYSLLQANIHDASNIPGTRQCNIQCLPLKMGLSCRHLIGFHTSCV